MPAPPTSSSTTKRRPSGAEGFSLRVSSAAKTWAATLPFASSQPRPEMIMSPSSFSAAEYGMKGGTVSMWLVRRMEGFEADEDGYAKTLNRDVRPGTDCLITSKL